MPYGGLSGESPTKKRLAREGGVITASRGQAVFFCISGGRCLRLVRLAIASLAILRSPIVTTVQAAAPASCRRCLVLDSTAISGREITRAWS